MTTSDWRARRGLSFVQRKEIASDVLEETELRAEEFAKFVSLDRVDPGIVELQLNGMRSFARMIPSFDTVGSQPSVSGVRSSVGSEPSQTNVAQRWSCLV
jgi:hypothetical protein